MTGPGLLLTSFKGKTSWPACLILVTTLLLSVQYLFAGGQWSVSTSAQVTRGNYIFEGNTTSYYFYAGLRYQADRWSVSTSLPLIVQKNDLVTYTGGMFLPTGAMHHGDGDMRDYSGTGVMGDHDNWGNNGMHSMSPFNNLDYALGDLYIYSEWLLLREQASRPSLSLNTQVKVPTANKTKNYGTGEYDYGIGLSTRKSMSAFFLFVDIGFVAIGDPQTVTFTDPMTFGLGIGRFFRGERSSVILYYQSSSEVLPGYQPPQQLSLGYFFRLVPNIMASMVGLAGMSDTSPDVSFLGGLRFEL